MNARIRELWHTGFGMTSDERVAVCIVLLLALLGLSTKAWHASRATASPSLSAEAGGRASEGGARVEPAAP